MAEELSENNVVSIPSRITLPGGNNLIPFVLVTFFLDTLMVPCHVHHFQKCKLTFIHWVCQEKLLLHAILISLTESVVPLVAASKTSQEAWLKLAKLHANRSRNHIIQLKRRLTLNLGTRSVPNYLNDIKVIVDELDLFDAPVNEKDVIVYTLRGMGTKYKEPVAATHNSDSQISFKKLYDRDH